MEDLSGVFQTPDEEQEEHPLRKQRGFLSKALDKMLMLNPATALPSRLLFKPEEDDRIGRMNRAAAEGVVESATLGYINPNTEYENEHTSDNIARFAGQIAGNLLPFGLAGKGLKAAGYAGKTVVSRIAGQAGIGAGTGFLSKAEEDESRLKNALTTGLSFAAFSGASEAIRAGYGQLAKKVIANKKKSQFKADKKQLRRMEAAERRTQRIAAEVNKRKNSGEFDFELHEALNQRGFDLKTRNDFIKWIDKPDRSAHDIFTKLSQDPVVDLQIKQRLLNIDELNAKPFRDMAEALGVRTELIEPQSLLSKIFTNTLEFADKLDTKTKGIVRVYENVHKLILGNQDAKNIKNKIFTMFEPHIKKLKKMGLSNNDITELMYYIEGDPTNPNFNPFFNPSKLVIPGKEYINAYDYKKWAEKLTNLGYKSSIPEGEIFNELSAIRKVFDSVFRDYPKVFKDSGNMKRYVTRLGKIPKNRIMEFKDKPAKTISEKLLGRSEADVAKERILTGNKDRAKKLANRDFVDIIDYYSSEVGNAVGFKDTLPQYQKMIWKLKALGLDIEAKSLEDAAAKALGVKDMTYVRKITAEKLAGMAAEEVDDLLKGMGLKPTLAEDLFRGANELMYKAFIGMNPKTIFIKQPLQPDMVGAGETGWKWIQIGRKEYLKGTYKNLLEEVSPQLRAEILDVAGTGLASPQRAWIKELTDILGWAGKHGMKVFTNLDMTNRQTAFLAGYLKTKSSLQDATGRELHRTIEHLLPAERVLIQKTLQNEGQEAAARLAGVIFSRRINFDYGIINKPELLRGDFTKLIPFTTWGRNQLVRVIGDVKGENYEQLVKRIAVPMAYITAVKFLTGYDMGEVHPLSTIPSAMPQTPLPSVTGAIKTAGYRGLPAGIKEAARGIPATKVYTEGDRVRKIFKKEKMPDAVAQGIFRMTKDGYLTELMKLMGVKE